MGLLSSETIARASAAIDTKGSPLPASAVIRIDNQILYPTACRRQREVEPDFRASA